MVTVEEALAVGTRQHQAGQLAAAEKIYRQILAVDPENPVALHQLGLLALECRKWDTAVDLISRAIRRDRMQAAFHANLGEAYRHLKNFDQAVACLRHALKLQPQLAKVHVMLGALLREQGKSAEAAVALREALRLKPEDFEARTQLGYSLLDQKKYSEAEACFRRLIRQDPSCAEATFSLGNVLQEQDRLEEAAGYYRQAIQLDPNHVDAHNNLGTILAKENRTAEAIEHYQTAIRLKPDCVAAHVNLGGLYIGDNKLEAAQASYEKALSLDSSVVLARQNLGSVLQKQGRLDEAMACFKEVLRIDPNSPLAHLGIGNTLQSQSMWSAAIASCSEAIRIDPNCAEAYANMAVALTGQGRHDESIHYCQRAIELNPKMAAAHGNMAVALQAVGRLDESIEHHRKAIELSPKDAGVHSNLLYALNYHPGLDAQTIFAEHLAWGQIHADPLTAKSLPHAVDRTPNRRLRVGYVSPNFMAHAVNFFSEPILAAHDHGQFEVFCYSDVISPDETTARLQGFADHWRAIVGRTDEQVSELVRADGIDILVDLTGHINGGRRMMVFARKPAPIQVTYIGYQNTTGMTAMDYRLTDEYADPPGQTEMLHTERLARLPTTFFCYLPSHDAPPVGPLPALTNGYVTFGSVNNYTKITPQVFETWSRLLKSVPNSRLVLRADMTEWLRHHIQETFTSLGIEAARVELINRLPRKAYLELISHCDIALDPFPFNGHTTTCDCVWQGVPVITLSGDTYVQRFGGSGLVTLGQSDWIARTPQQYVEIGTALAGDVDRLQRLRGELRGRMAASPLCDFAGFTRNLEAEYRRMWEAWCAG